jgi:hypothetical protein
MYIQGGLSRSGFGKKIMAVAGMAVIVVAGFATSTIVNADVATTITCKDGTKVEVGGTDHRGVVACFKHGGPSPFHGKEARGIILKARADKEMNSAERKR